MSPNVRCLVSQLLEAEIQRLSVLGKGEWQLRAVKLLTLTKLSVTFRDLRNGLGWRSSDPQAGIAFDHSPGKLREILWVLGRTGVVRSNAQVFGSEAKGESGGELLEGLHLEVEPSF